jgi:ABC-type branched-subunit amino acid transport system permease subunit
LTLRLSGPYLPVGTLAWGIALYFLFGNLDFLGVHTAAAFQHSASPGSNCAMAASSIF